MFAPSHRGGSGPPLVCIHGFMDTWRSWELVLPALERGHDVLAVTLPGHAGGPPAGDGGGEAVLDALEHALDDAGFETAHLVGNSLGGYAALRLAERGRADSVVALAPAGGWAEGDESFRELLDQQATLHELLGQVAPFADAIVAEDAGRRQVTEMITVEYEHIPPELLAHLIAGAAACEAGPLLEIARREGWPLEPERIRCPLRLVWGTADQVLPWPSAAARFREALPHADWVVLDGVGHCPQLDVPVETAQLILGFTS
jgi:pimeloyl-ACP methyl ester carboxylesterase